MRVLFTGATGVIGRAAVPVLVAAGHEVRGVARDDPSGRWLADHGAEPVEVDLFDPEAVDSAVRKVEAVAHMATAIPPLARMRQPAAWETNDRLRREATRALVDAALAHGVGRFVQQSIALLYADGGDTWLDEDAPLDPPVSVTESALDAEAEAQRFAAGGGAAIVLRLGRLYGPGSASAELVGMIAGRKVPVVGRGSNYVSSLHAEDAGTALAAALTAPAGVYNLADDEPVTAREHVGILAEALGARPPRRVPVWLARRALGDTVTMLVRSQRVSNRRFREASGWAPAYPGVRIGWHTVAGGDPPRKGGSRP